MDCRTPGSPVLHYLPEFAQIQVFNVDNAIQRSHPLPSSFCLQSFPELDSVPKSWIFTSDCQSIGASTSVLPMNIQGRFPLGFAGVIIFDVVFFAS